MFASLLAPGVLSAYTDDGDEVTGFAASSGGAAAGPEVDWRPGALAEALGQAFREGGVKVVGLDE